MTQANSSKFDQTELEQIARSCIDGRITVSNPYSTPSNWAGTVTNCQVRNSLFHFHAESDEAEGRPMPLRKVSCVIGGVGQLNIAHGPSRKLTISGSVVTATIEPAAATSSWRNLKVITAEVIRESQERAKRIDRASRILLLAAAVVCAVLAICLARLPIVSTRHHLRAHVAMAAGGYAALLAAMRIIAPHMHIGEPQ